jgi:hypothetical protein
MVISTLKCVLLLGFSKFFLKELKDKLDDMQEKIEKIASKVFFSLSL